MFKERIAENHMTEFESAYTREMYLGFNYEGDFQRPDHLHVKRWCFQVQLQCECRVAILQFVKLESPAESKQRLLDRMNGVEVRTTTTTAKPVREVHASIVAESIFAQLRIDAVTKRQSTNET